MENHGVSETQGDIFFKVENMHCASCVEKISRAVEESKLTENYWVDLATHRLRVRKGHLGLSDRDFSAEIIRVLKKTGYAAQQVRDSHAPQENAWIWQLLFSGVGLLASYFLLPKLSVPFSREHLLHLGAVVVLFVLSYKSFIRGAWHSLKNSEFSVDTLVSLGAGAAVVLSLTLTLAQIPGHVFWVEAFSILLLVSFGHYLENFVLVKADKTLRGLMILAPSKAQRLKDDGTQEEVLISALHVGDVLLVRPGDRVSVDGKIIEGKSDLDESLLTGESMPLAKGVGDLIFSGTLNLSGNLKFTVQKLGSDMLLSQIIDTVLRVRKSRANIQKFADRVSNIFVPAVIALSLLCFFLWYFAPDLMSSLASHWSHLGMPDMQKDSFWRAFSAALGVLVISCPCAMGLATPAALLAVSGIAAKKGILIRDGRAIENAEKITHVFFDKTGTLSAAQPKLVNEWKSADFDGALVVPVASQSRHPMSHRLAQRSDLPTKAYRALIEEHPGEGLVAQIQGYAANMKVIMGSAALLQRMDVHGMAQVQSFVLGELEQGRSLVYWAQNGSLSAVFSFEDELREGVEHLLQKFSRVAQVRVLSGDNKKSIQNVATKLGIKSEYALGELSPLDKVQVLQSYQKNKEKVAFIGDGLNDAPVLQAADLGIAVSSASDLAKQSADIILLTKDLDAIFSAFTLAKRGMQTIRQNLMWAFAYNVVAIPLAFFGLMSPVLCTASMAFSDLVIIANSLRVFMVHKRE